MPRPGIVLLIATACLAAQAPDSADDRAILDAGLQNALAFTSTLPDFMCIQSIRRFQSRAGSDSWAPTDRLAIQLRYTGGTEDYHLVSIDDRPTNQPYHAVGGAVTNGEFGSWLHSVFDPASAAEFRMEGRATARERPVVVFSYSVARDHSHYDLNYRDAPGHVASATVGYHGRVYIDQATRYVTRLEIDASDIPARFPLQRSSIVLEYTFTDIAGRQYLLPLYAETRIATPKLDYRNEIEFQGYRKFEASSTMLGDESTTISNEPEPPHDSASTGLARLSDDRPVFPPPVEPSVEERRAALEEARRAAVDYLASLPSFGCFDIFRISTSKSGQSWKSRGVVTGQIRHRESGADSFEPLRFDENATANATEFEGALSAMGSWNVEFEKLRNNILDPHSAAEFEWTHLSNLRGRTTHVYSFQVRAGSSYYPIAAEVRDSFVHSPTTVALRGFVFVDRDSRRVVRIYSEPIAIPATIDVSNASTQLDFDFAQIAGAPVLVPLHITLRADSKSQMKRYESEFSSCGR